MYVRALTATVLATLASQAQGQQLDAALRDTMSSDPQIAGADAQVRAAEAAVDIERAARLPMLTLDAHAGYQVAETLYGLRRARPLGVGIGVDLPLYTGGELTWRIRASRAALEGERARRELLVNMRLSTAAARYAGLYRDGRIEAARQTQVANVATLLDATRERQRVGAATETDTHQGVARLAVSKARLAEARAALTRSQEDLREVTGRYVEAVEDADPPALFNGTLSDAAMADLPAQVAQFPAMKLAGARVAMAQAEVRVARSQRLPRLSLSSMTQTANDLGSNNLGNVALPARFQTGMQAGLTLRVPLFQGGAPAARLRQAQQTLAGRGEERRATEMQLIAQIRSQFAQLKAADRALPAIARALAAGRAALTGVQAEITVGTRSSLDALNAQEEVTQVEIQLAQVRQQRLALAYSILAMMGKLAPDPAPVPVRVAVAVPAPVAVRPRLALSYDKVGLWVWKGSTTWSLTRRSPRTGSGGSKDRA